MPGKRINKQKVKSAKTPKKVRRARVRNTPVMSGIDKASRDWIRLMADPCNADLVQPCYGGTGTGYLARTRQYVYVPFTAKDYLLEFTPSYQSNAVFRYGYSDTTSGALGVCSALALAGLAGSDVCGRRRCVAACIKVIYTGPELDRSGLVAMTLDSGMSLTAGETIAPVTDGWLMSMPHTARMGSAVHEVVWVPGGGDDQFVANHQATESPPTSSNGNSLQIVIKGAPAGTFTVECTSVWEWQPAEDRTAAAGYAPGVSIMRGPPSSVPLSTILHSIGSIGKFALQRVVAAAPMWAGPAGPAIREYGAPALKSLGWT